MEDCAREFSCTLYVYIYATCLYSCTGSYSCTFLHVRDTGYSMPDTYHLSGSTVYPRQLVASGSAVLSVDHTVLARDTTLSASRSV